MEPSSSSQSNRDPISARKRLAIWNFFLMFFAYTTYHVLRASFTFTVPTLVDELGYTKQELGYPASGFALGYAIGKFFGGVLSDVVNPRKMLCCGLFATAMINVMLSFNDTVLHFTLFWTANGFAQGFGWPPCAKLLYMWFPKSELGFWWSFLSTSGNSGRVFLPFILAALSDCCGWRSAFAIIGFAGALVSVGTFVLMTGQPPAKLKRDSDGKAQVDEKVADTTPVVKRSLGTLAHYFVTNIPFVLCCVCYVFINFQRSAITNWGFLYLRQDKQRGPMAAAYTWSAFPLGGIISSLVLGYISDIVAEHFRLRSKLEKVGGLSRAWLMALCLFMQVVLLQAFRHIAVSPDVQLLDLAVLFLVSGFIFGPINLIGLLTRDVVDDSLGGTASAIIGVISQFGVMLGGFPYSTYVEQAGWEAGMILVQCATVASLAITVGICQRTVPLSTMWKPVLKEKIK